jgi:hypothetical protein
LPLDVRPKRHCLRRCLAASSRTLMGSNYHGSQPPASASDGQEPLMR